MSTPFDKCSVLEVTMARERGQFKNSEFKNCGKLIMMIDGHGFVHHFILPGGVFMKPEEINEVLEGLGESIRVDGEGRPYVFERRPGDAGETSGVEGSHAEDTNGLRLAVPNHQLP